MIDLDDVADLTAARLKGREQPLEEVITGLERALVSRRQATAEHPGCDAASWLEVEEEESGE